jgi:hypothetical protein
MCTSSFSITTTKYLRQVTYEIKRFTLLTVLDAESPNDMAQTF